MRSYLIILQSKDISWVRNLLCGSASKSNYFDNLSLVSTDEEMENMT